MPDHHDEHQSFKEQLRAKHAELQKAKQQEQKAPPEQAKEAQPAKERGDMAKAVKEASQDKTVTRGLDHVKQAPEPER